MAEGSSSRGSLKRDFSFLEDDESSKQPPEKRVRFPKGKKVKQGDYVTTSLVENDSKKEASIAARDRSIRRATIKADLLNDENNDLVPDIKKAEVRYEENEAFDEEGVTIEPFNLDKEREDGYFDENGNYVEYVNEKIKDSWLDNVDAYQKYTGKSSVPTSNDDQPSELTTDELAEINRRIADVLQPGETVLLALRRLKGSTDKKQKMSTETKQQFDQLTEYAMKLIDNGDYNAYYEKQEHFQREAEGYEKIINARKHGLSESMGQDKSDDMFDIFGDDNDESAAQNPASNGSESISVQPSEGGDMQSDYVYDETSGYYYSSSLGYYYDPSSGLYCSATTGKWYSYNQESGTYDEVQQQDTSMANED